MRRLLLLSFLAVLVLPATDALAAKVKISPKGVTVSASGVASVEVANPNRYAMRGTATVITGQQQLARKKRPAGQAVGRRREGQAQPAGPGGRPHLRRPRDRLAEAPPPRREEVLHGQALDRAEAPGRGSRPGAQAAPAPAPDSRPARPAGPAAWAPRARTTTSSSASRTAQIDVHEGTVRPGLLRRDGRPEPHRALARAVRRRPARGRSAQDAQRREVRDRGQHAGQQRREDHRLQVSQPSRPPRRSPASWQIVFSHSKLDILGGYKMTYSNRPGNAVPSRRSPPGA